MSGEVLIDGRDLMKMSESALRGEERRHIGMIQHFNLLSSATVYENVAFPLKLAGKSTGEIAEGHGGRCPSWGSQTRRMPTRAIFGGQVEGQGRHRARTRERSKGVSFAMRRPRRLTRRRRNPSALIRDINRRMGLTVVVITHEMQVIKDICDRVAVIDGGIIAEEGDSGRVHRAARADHEGVDQRPARTSSPTAFRGNPITKEPSPDSYMLLRLTFLGERADARARGYDPTLPDIEVTMLFGTPDRMISRSAA